jgi:16S rRNA (uracil1498-N3)-methyltransferase
VSGFRPRFFLSALSDAEASPLAAGTTLVLDAEDSHHAVRVLRLKPGDECEVVVGAAAYTATVLPTATVPPTETASPKSTFQVGLQVRVVERMEGAAAGARYRFEVGLVQAIVRPAAVDWAIEKSTEAGASFILLVQAAGSPGRSLEDSDSRLARWSRIAREAAKQSKQLVVPQVESAASFEKALESLRLRRVVSFLLDPRAERTLYDVLCLSGGAPLPLWAAPLGQDAPAGPGRKGERAEVRGLALWVGPEGGWSEDERERLTGSGAVAVRLGQGVLRTETAGPVATAVARLALGDW